MIFRINEKREGSTKELSGIVDGFFRETGLEREYAVEMLKRIWHDVTGNIISTHSSPVRIAGKTLYIYADHPVFANDISMMKDIILSKISELSSIRNLTGIKVEVSKKILWEKEKK